MLIRSIGCRYKSTRGPRLKKRKVDCKFLDGCLRSQGLASEAALADSDAAAFENVVGKFISYGESEC